MNEESYAAKTETEPLKFIVLLSLLAWVAIFLTIHKALLLIYSLIAYPLTLAINYFFKKELMQDSETKNVFKAIGVYSDDSRITKELKTIRKKFLKSYRLFYPQLGGNCREKALKHLIALADTEFKKEIDFIAKSNFKEKSSLLKQILSQIFFLLFFVFTAPLKSLVIISSSALDKSYLAFDGISSAFLATERTELVKKKQQILDKLLGPEKVIKDAHSELIDFLATNILSIRRKDAKIKNKANNAANNTAPSRPNSSVTEFEIIKQCEEVIQSYQQDRHVKYTLANIAVKANDNIPRCQFACCAGRGDMQA